MSPLTLSRARVTTHTITRTCHHLHTTPIEGAAITLQRIDDVHDSDGLAAGVLSVSHCILDDILEEQLEGHTGLLVDETRDALHTTTASETADGGLGDALGVVAEHLAVALEAALAESLASLAASSRTG